MIRIDTSVTFLLPFDRYSLTLSHRLLDSMGGVSRFLLRAIEQELSLAALIEVTGLGKAVLLNQLAFLQSHRYLHIKDGDDEPMLGLTPRGATIVQVERLLKDFELTIWLDAFTLRRHAVHLLLLADPVATTLHASVADVDGVVVRMPRRPGRAGRSGQYSLFDETNRLRLLLDRGGLKKLLAHCWGEDCELIASEYEHWDVELHSQEGEPGEVHLPVDYAPGDLALRLHTGGSNGKAPVLPWVSVPVLELTHVFKRVPQFPWLVEVPPMVMQHLELVSFGTLNHFTEQAVVDGSGSDYSAMPACLGKQVPSGIPSFPAPLGTSSEVSARNLQLLCSMDEPQLSRHMQACPDALVLSYNLVLVEEEHLA